MEQGERGREREICFLLAQCVDRQLVCVCVCVSACVCVCVFYALRNNGLNRQADIFDRIWLII